MKKTGVVKYVLYIYAATTKKYTEASLDMKKQTLFSCLFTGHFRISNHKTFSLLLWTSTFVVFASPRVYGNKSLVWRRRDPESFMAALSVPRKLGTIWVRMSPFISAICILTSKSSFSAFPGSLCFVSGGVQFVPWRKCCLVLLWCPCPPLPCICAEGSSCASWLVSQLELHSFSSARLFLVLLTGKGEPRGKHDHSGFDSQTGKCL